MEEKRTNMPKEKKKKQKIRIFFKDGKTDVIPQKF